MLSSHILIPLVLVAVSFAFLIGMFVIVGKVDAATEDLIGVGLILTTLLCLIFRFSGLMLLFSLTSFTFFVRILLEQTWRFRGALIAGVGFVFSAIVVMWILSQTLWIPVAVVGQDGVPMACENNPLWWTDMSNLKSNRASIDCTDRVIQNATVVRDVSMLVSIIVIAGLGAVVLTTLVVLVGATRRAISRGSEFQSSINKDMKGIIIIMFFVLFIGLFGMIMKVITG